MTRELIAKAQAGDLVAQTEFAKWLMVKVPQIKFIRTMIGYGPHEQEDMVMAGVTKAYSDLKGYDPQKTDPITFFMASARYGAIDLIRITKKWHDTMDSAGGDKFNLVYRWVGASTVGGRDMGVLVARVLALATLELSEEEAIILAGRVFGKSYDELAVEVGRCASWVSTKHRSLEGWVGRTLVALCPEDRRDHDTVCV